VTIATGRGGATVRLIGPLASALQLAEDFLQHRDLVLPVFQSSRDNDQRGCAGIFDDQRFPSRNVHSLDTALSSSQLTPIGRSRDCVLDPMALGRKGRIWRVWWLWWLRLG